MQIVYSYTTSQKFLNSKIFNVFKKVSSAHQACLYLMQSTAKSLKCWNSGDKLYHTNLTFNILMCVCHLPESPKRCKGTTVEYQWHNMPACHGLPPLRNYHFHFYSLVTHRNGQHHQPKVKKQQHSNPVSALAVFNQFHVNK